MKKLKEIEQLADKIYFKVDGFEEEISESKRHFIHGYTLCQEDMIKEIDNLKFQLRTYEAKEPKYAVEGDYCSVCGCTEFWNDEEEIN